MAQDNDTFTEMFIGAIFGLIIGQVIAGCLEMKGFALPIFFAIVGAVIPFSVINSYLIFIL